MSEIAEEALTDMIKMKQTHKNDLAPIVERLRMWTVNSANYLSFHKLTKTELNVEMREYFKAIMSFLDSFIDHHDRRISQLFSNKKRDKLQRS